MLFIALPQQEIGVIVATNGQLLTRPSIPLELSSHNPHGQIDWAIRSWTAFSYPPTQSTHIEKQIYVPITTNISVDYCQTVSGYMKLRPELRIKRDPRDRKSLFWARGVRQTDRTDPASISKQRKGGKDVLLSLRRIVMASSSATTVSESGFEVR